MKLKRNNLFVLAQALLLLTATGSNCLSSGQGSTIDGDAPDRLTRLYEAVWEEPPTGPRVLLARMDKAGRLLILSNDLDIPARIQQADALPYSTNSSGAVWVGTQFPFEKAVKLIGWSHNYYLGLRYVALSDYVNQETSRYDEDLYIGGSTETAVTRLNLSAWQASDWQALGRVSNQEEFHSLIRSHYPADPASAPTNNK